MTHATVLAIRTLLDHQEPRVGVLRAPVGHDEFIDWPAGTAACSWTGSRENFGIGDVIALLSGNRVELPTCPQCAVYVDMALELRGT